MIHGHTHRPQVHELELGEEKAQRVVLGDWDSHGWFAEIDARVLRLEMFPL
jgi:UDP-2,3-diacylglucosamine hydrolase